MGLLSKVYHICIYGATHVRDICFKFFERVCTFLEQVSSLFQCDQSNPENESPEFGKKIRGSMDNEKIHRAIFAGFVHNARFLEERFLLLFIKYSRRFGKTGTELRKISWLSPICQNIFTNLYCCKPRNE